MLLDLDMIIFSCEFGEENKKKLKEGEEDKWDFYLWIKYNILKNENYNIFK